MADRCSHGARLGCCDECNERYEGNAELADLVADAVVERLTEALRQMALMWLEAQR